MWQACALGVREPGTAAERSLHRFVLMDAIDLLKVQHEEVRDLFKNIEQAEDDEDKLALFEELADNLAAHATIEEKLFYPAAYKNKTQEVLTEAVEEHLAMKRLLADLNDLLPDHANFDAKLKVLKEQFEHHVGEEESEIFKAARKVIGEQRLNELGDEMMELFEDELEREPGQQVAAQTDQAAPLT
jgi:hypothetical protein